MRISLKSLSLLLAACVSSATLMADEPSIRICDDACDTIARDELAGIFNSRSTCWLNDVRYRTPAMMGDFFGGSALGFRGAPVVDRLMVLADDLDAPFVLPAAGSTLTITEPGPVQIFSGLSSVQQQQAILRGTAPAPQTFFQVTINDNATLTTANSIGQIQTQLGSTPLGFDIIRIQAPPTTYTNSVHNAFQVRNGVGGTTVYDSNSSGALLQGGVDTLTGGEDFDAYYFYDYVIRFNATLADAASGGVGRTKIADGGSILPQNRVFFRYSNIQNVMFTSSGATLNRLTPGFERSLLGGLASFELRAPFATDATTTYAYDTGSFSNGEHTRFGNLTLYAKGLLHQTQQISLVGGLGVALPTAQDIEVNYANGTSLLQVQNQAVHLQPFVGALFTPNDRLFAQGFVQYDAAASGNTVAINSTGTGLQTAGRLTDPNNIYIDAAVDYWLYQSNEQRGLTGVVPTLEVHQSSSTQSGDLVSAGPFQVGNFGGSTSQTSIVAGSTFEFGRQTQLTAGYATPIGGGADQLYNGAFQFNFNRLLGP